MDKALGLQIVVLDARTALRHRSLKAAQGSPPETPGEKARLRRHLERKHSWPVDQEDLSSGEALRGMHAAAHLLRKNDVAVRASNLRELKAMSPEEKAQCEEYWSQFPEEDDDPAYEKWLEEMEFIQDRLCGTSLTTGPHHDPYMTQCVKGAGHSPHTRHKGDDPFRQDGAFVYWRGGGWNPVDNEPAAAREVKWVRPQ